MVDGSHAAFYLVIFQQRHRSDNQVNNRKSEVLRGGKLVDERWYKVQVGDVIRMENDQFVAVSFPRSSINALGDLNKKTMSISGRFNGVVHE